MENLMSTLLVPAYFAHGAVGMGILAWWFMTRGNKKLKSFGKGLLGYSLGMAAWALLVLIRPADLEPLILVGVVPFAIAHLAYAKAAYGGEEKDKGRLAIYLVGLGVLAIFAIRTFVFPSAPYYSAQGSFFFGLHPVAMAFYIAVIGASFLPAIRSAVREIKDKKVRTIMDVALTTMFLNIILQLSVTYDTLLIINGVVLTGALFIGWITALRAKSSEL